MVHRFFFPFFEDTSLSLLKNLGSGRCIFPLGMPEVYHSLRWMNMPRNGQRGSTLAVEEEVEEAEVNSEAEWVETRAERHFDHERQLDLGPGARGTRPWYFCAFSGNGVQFF